MQFNDLVFIGNPRCCCTGTVEYWNSKGIYIDYWHDPLQYYTKRLSNPQDYKYYMIIRNPWDRFVSWWHQHRRHNHNFIMKYKNFDEWVKSGEYHDWPDHTQGDPRPETREYWKTHSPLLQTDFLENDLGIEVNLMRIEDINTEFPKFTKEYFDEEVILNKVNSTDRKDYYEYFTDETLEIVNEYLKKDIEFLNYEY